MKLYIITGTAIYTTVGHLFTGSSWYYQCW